MDVIDKALAVYSYHIEQQKKRGAAIKGHFDCEAHSLKHTAKDFNMSVGRACQLMIQAKAYLYDNAVACKILKAHGELHKCKRRKK